MLKSELHAHINLDPVDVGTVCYSAKELIDEMKRRAYDVLAITCHDYYFDDEDVIEYAKAHGIILICGVEKTIQKKHTLIYNAPKSVIDVKTLDELRELKKKYPEMLVIAPHPFFGFSQSHRNNIKKHRDLFDAYEYSFFFSRFFNMNRKTMRIAKKYNKPVVGNCDIHSLRFEGNVCTLIDSDPNEESIINAIKAGKVQHVTNPISSKRFIKLFFLIGLKMILYKFTKRTRSRH